jgi:hypothetical protein
MPMLKKPGLDAADVLALNLSLVIELLERSIAQQLVE